MTTAQDTKKGAVMTVSTAHRHHRTSTKTIGLAFAAAVLAVGTGSSILLVTPAHAEPAAGCPLAGGFLLAERDFPDVDKNADGFICAKPLETGFVVIDNRVP
jgi:hypothetical protein